MSVEHRIRVRLARGVAYEVLVGRGLLDELGAFAKKANLTGPCAVVTDDHVHDLYGERVCGALEADGIPSVKIAVPAGETSKSLGHVEAICEAMQKANLDRHCWVAALGGGVVGDLAGFVASIYFRGVPVIQVPTTVMAQVDSAVGGKTGVNLSGGKNLVGAFHQPKLVVADIDTLDSLPDRVFREGFAEIVKHAVIRDRNLFDGMIAAARHDRPGLIARNVAIKAAIVEADEQERAGVRELLNFGHTLGHAIEQAAGYGKYLHGEAISLGMRAATELSMAKAGLKPEEARMVVARLAELKLPLVLDKEIGTEALLAAMRKDKKFRQGTPRFVLARRIGEAVVTETVNEDDVEKAIDALRREPEVPKAAA